MLQILDLLQYLVPGGLTADFHKSGRVTTLRYWNYIPLELWGRYMANHSVLFLTDNAVVVEVINKQSAKNLHLMRLVRRLVVIALKCNVYFKSKHIPGKTNVIVDKRSRFREGAARQMAPWLQLLPIEMPATLLPWHQ